MKKQGYKKAIHSCRITCKRSESARERRIALYKSDQQQQQYIITPPHELPHVVFGGLSARVCQLGPGWGLGWMELRV